MEESRAPHSAHPFQLARLQPDEFEELTFMLAHKEDRRVVRMRAPDGGLDTVLPDAGDPNRAERGWQAKRHTKGIDFRDCEQSLKRAIDVWKVSHYTFTFPHDLTIGERQTFTARLDEPYPGVTVDYMSASPICARLLADEGGERIARRFFREWDMVAALERVLDAREQGSGGDGLHDTGSIEEFVQRQDPRFDWVIRTQRPGAPEPPREPGSMMRLQLALKEQIVFIDAAPRSDMPRDERPSVTVISDDSPQGREAGRLIGELMKSGGRLRLREGVRVAFERLPKPFADVLSEQLPGDVVVKAVGQPAPWYARLVAEGEFGRRDFDVDLMPTEPPEDWDAQLQGTRAGLTLTMRFRWSVNEGRGELRLNFQLGPSAAPIGDRAEALGLALALHGPGTLRVHDRAGARKDPLVQELAPLPVPREHVRLHRLLVDLAEIERFTGRPMPSVPGEVSGEEAANIGWLAQALRDGGYGARMTSAQATLGSAGVAAFRSSGSDIKVRETMHARIFGEEVPVAERVLQLPLMTARNRIRVGSDSWEVELVPLHAHEIEVWAELQPLPSDQGPQAQAA